MRGRALAGERAPEDRRFLSLVQRALLAQARGADAASPAISFKSNSTYGLALGYFLIPSLSVGAELRYQRYVTTPASVEKGATTRQNMTGAGGVRTHFQLAKGVWMRPGLSYGHGIVGPVEKAGYHIVSFDIPVSF